MQENASPTEQEQTTPNDLELALSIPEACRSSKLSRSFIYQEIAAGRLIARKAGARTIVLPKDLRAYLANLPRAACAEGQNCSDLTPAAPDNRAANDEPEAQAASRFRRSLASRGAPKHPRLRRP